MRLHTFFLSSILGAQALAGRRIIRRVQGTFWVLSLLKLIIILCFYSITSSNLFISLSIVSRVLQDVDEETNAAVVVDSGQLLNELKYFLYIRLHERPQPWSYPFNWIRSHVMRRSWAWHDKTFGHFQKKIFLFWKRRSNDFDSNIFKFFNFKR